MANETAAHSAKGIRKYVAQYLESLKPERGAVALDIPSGDGSTSAQLRDLGMRVIACDLSADAFQADGLRCEYADMSEPLPLENEAVDVVVCQEGIEHVPNQMALLEEFNRVLKPGGTLILTTPNSSHIRARVSRLLVGSDLLKRLPPSEVDCIWGIDRSGKIYFGHLFLLEVNQLWVFARLAGFDVAQTRRTAVSASSVILGVVLAPLIAASMLSAYRASNKRYNPSGNAEMTAVLRTQLMTNLSPKTLFCKHIFWVLSKRSSVAEHHEHLRRFVRSGGWVYRTAAGDRRECSAG